MSTFDSKIFCFDRIGLSAPVTDRLEYWKAFISAYQCKNVAEVGVWKGQFAKEILTDCEQVEIYYMIDPWRKLDDWNKPFNVDDRAFSDIYTEALERTDFARNRRVVLRDRTLRAAEQIPDDSLDLVYIDGDHTLRGITHDLEAMFGKVRDGGVIAGDDLTITPWHHAPEFEPSLVFPYVVYFAEAKGLPICALGANQFVIIKNTEIGFRFHDFTNQYQRTDLLSLDRR